jgi:hypothetical protein
VPSGVTGLRASHDRSAHPLRVVRERGANVVGVRSSLLRITRLWLPLGIAIAGVVLIVIGRGHTGSAAAGVGLLIVAVIVWMVNWMFRMSVESNRERDREEEARRYFDEHGRWPDE